jgi:hypothetical protein
MDHTAFYPTINDAWTDHVLTSLINPQQTGDQ